MDEILREHLAEELREVREKLRLLRAEIQHLEADVLRGDNSKQAELERARERLERLRPRHDELADLLEGRIDERSPGAIASLFDFLADHRWAIAGVAAMALLVALMFLLSRPQVTEEERQKVKRALMGAAAEQVESQASAAAARQEAVRREMERAERGR